MCLCLLPHIPESLYLANYYHSNAYSDRLVPVVLLLSLPKFYFAGKALVPIVVHYEDSGGRLHSLQTAFESAEGMDQMSRFQRSILFKTTK